MHHRSLCRITAGVVPLLAALVLAGPARAVINGTAQCQATGGLPDNDFGPTALCSSDGTTVVGSTVLATHAGGAALNLGFTFQTNGLVENGGSVLAAMGGGFEAAVFAIDVLPVPVTSIPLIVSGAFSTTLAGQPPLSRALGDLQIEAFRLNGIFPVLREEVSLSFDDQNPPGLSVLELPYDYLLDGQLDLNLQFGGSSTCDTFASPGSSADCGIQITFDVVFDQDTFDQQMGASTFPLDQYFLILPLPEPGSGAMLGSGALALLALGRRRSRRAP